VKGLTAFLVRNPVVEPSKSAHCRCSSTTLQDLTGEMEDSNEMVVVQHLQALRLGDDVEDNSPYRTTERPPGAWSSTWSLTVSRIATGVIMHRLIALLKKQSSDERSDSQELPLHYHRTPTPSISHRETQSMEEGALKLVGHT
jgi:hypothetical protein